MMTGGLLARYLSPAMGFFHHTTEQENGIAEQRQKNQDEADRYYTATGNNNSSSCRPPPSPRLPLSSTETQSVSEFSPCSSSISPLSSSSSSTSSSSVPSSLLFDMPCWVSSAASSGSSLMTCRKTDSYNNTTSTTKYFSNNSSNSYTKNRTNTISSSCSRRRRDDEGKGGGGEEEDGSRSYYTCSSSSSHISPTRFPPLFVIPLILLLIVSNQGIVRHVQGQQVWSDPHHTAAGFGQQYASFEELQRLTENPFENNTAVNVTVPLGDNAFLRCKVRNLGERSISWVRRRDWHILTSGKTTYTNDERFHVLHADGSDDWTLQIKFVQKRDNGTYECQVSTGTGIVSYLVHLRVTVPEVFILGNGEYHVEQGSTISLVCVIEKSPKPPEYIFWYHNQRMINYGSSREVKVINEPGSKTHSRLTIRDAQISDSGNYTCETAHAEPASTLVYVSQGDQIAAIQKRKAAAAASSTSHVASSSLSSSSYHVAPIKLYLAIFLINLTLLVPFLLSQDQQQSPSTVSPSKIISTSSSHNHNHHNHLSQTPHHNHLRSLMQHQHSRQYSQLVH